MIDSDIASQVKAKEKAVLAQTAGIIYDANNENKKIMSVFLELIQMNF